MQLSISFSNEVKVRYDHRAKDGTATFPKGFFEADATILNVHAASSRRKMCMLCVSDANYLKFSYGATSYALK